jgi:hypothetical protein
MQQERIYRINEGSEHERFLNSRKKLRLFGGGFGNGKTALLCTMALQLASAYPGSNGLIARSTYPKLNDTIRKEFRKWCPSDWIKSWPQKDNVCTLVNGSTINFRYIAQQGKSNEASTSNLLSATYDWAVVDQIEDPEIEYKDFLDLLGRLRGSTAYRGNDPTMPESGPRWLLMNCNPTGNWVYTKLVKPYEEWKRTGKRNDDLIWDDEADEPMIEIYNSSTYENKDNLPSDFIKTLEASYKGTMRNRFLMGLWGAFEGLVYPTYDQQTHTIPKLDLQDMITDMKLAGRQPTWIEAYDWGKIAPSCYGLFYVDIWGNVVLADGFHQAEYDLDEQVKHIKQIRLEWTGKYMQPGKFYADPSIFRGGVQLNGVNVGKPISDLIQSIPNAHIRMQRGDNHLTNGIVKVSAYMSLIHNHRNPVTGQHPAPHFYHNEELDWFNTEITQYMWKKHNNTDQYIDIPVDKNDHAMNMIKYAFTDRPRIPTIINMPTSIMHRLTAGWHEAPEELGISARYT